MELDEALDYIQRNNLFLHFTSGSRLVDLWTPHKRTNLAVRRTIYKQHEAINLMMLMGDARVCSSPTLHKKEWTRATKGKRTCKACLRLNVDGFQLPATKTA